MRRLRFALLSSLVLTLVAVLAVPSFAGYNATAPNATRRIFTELALVDGRLVTYHVLEPGPVTIQAFPMGSGTGKLYRFPGCKGTLRPVLDDSAIPSADVTHLVYDEAMREVVNVTLRSCTTQPKSAADVKRMSKSQTSIGYVNAPAVPAPVGANVPTSEQQSADELWGPLPDIGIVDFFAGGDLSPQHVMGTTSSGVAISGVQQPNVRRPRILAYTGGRLVYFLTYETKNLAKSGLVTSSNERQWSGSGFPGERDLYFLAYGRAPLPPNTNIPAGSLDSNGVLNDNQAVVNVVKGAPFYSVGDYSPLWKMHCLDGGITPTIGPGAPCGDTRFYQIGQPQSISDVENTGLPIVAGVFQDINCPVLGTDVNNDGTFTNTSSSQEVVTFSDVDWDGNGIPDDGINDPNSTLQ